MADQITIHNKTEIVNNPNPQKNTLQKNRNLLVNTTQLTQTPRRVTNITLNYTPPKLRTILISELIYAYKDCESSLFRVPNLGIKELRNCKLSLVHETPWND